MADTPKDLQNLRAKIVAKAWKDPRFKKLLLSNPKAALKEFGYEVPESQQLRVIEDKENSFTFVLPAPPSNQVEELPDEQLQQVAGGIAWKDTKWKGGCGA